MATVVVVALTAPLVWSQQKLDIDPLELVRRASQNEIKANNAEHYCMFRDTIDYKDHSVSHEIIRTNQGGLWTTLLINGKPLTPEERQKDTDRVFPTRFCLPTSVPIAARPATNWCI
jgi:hypothetical protein